MKKIEVVVLRLGHRKERDKRVSTHVGLSARALGAAGVVYAGEDDEGLVKSVNALSERWGGRFRARYEPKWFSFLKHFPGVRVHLTMYGTRVEDAIPEILQSIKKGRAISAKMKGASVVKKSGVGKLLVVVGAEKVPREVYETCEFNVSVTSQPHSEIAALAVFLDRLFAARGRATVGPAKFAGAGIVVTPSARFKVVERKKNANEPLHKRVQKRGKAGALTKA